MFEFRAYHSCLWIFSVISYILSSLWLSFLFTQLAHLLQQSAEVSWILAAPPPPVVNMALLFHLHYLLVKPKGSWQTQHQSKALVLSLQSVCDVSEVPLCFGALFHTCSLVLAVVVAQSQSLWLITQSLRNKETGNINQPAWQLERRSTPLCEERHSN